MATERRNYAEEFKREAVRLMERSGKPVAQLARELGLNDNNLYRWRSIYGSERLVSNNSGSARVAELEAEVKRLRRENEILRQEPAMNYQMVEANRGEASVEQMCQTLGVSVSGYYA